jgi:hypothetical protein
VIPTGSGGTKRTKLLPKIYLVRALRVICDLVGGQIGLEKVVDDGNLTAFIIRYRLENN